MAANDVTVSLAAASAASIKVRVTSCRSRDTQHAPSSLVDPVTVAANSNTVINLQPGDAIYVERVDTPNSVVNAVHHGGSKEKFNT